MVDTPPVAGNSVGLALTRTLPTAAVPTRIFNAAEELLRDPALKDAFKAAIENGSVLVVEKD